MPVAVRHAGQVNSRGELVLSDSSAWRTAVARHKGHDVWVTITRQQHLRTLPANKYYWGVVVDSIAGYIGEDRTSTHELLKAKFLPPREVELLDGQSLTMPPSTRVLTVEQFSEYVNAVKVWAAQFLGLALPEADQLEAVL